jgi:hypothetical protein
VVITHVAGNGGHGPHAALRKHGGGLAFFGLALGPVAIFFGQSRFRPQRGGLLWGRWLAVRAMAPLILIVGALGVVMVARSY